MLHLNMLVSLIHFVSCQNNNGAQAALASRCMHTFVSIPSSLWFFCRTCWRASWIFCWSFSTFTFSWSQDRSAKVNNQIFSEANTRRNETASLNWKSETGGSSLCFGECVSAFFPPPLSELWLTPTSRHQHKGREQGDLILRQVHRTQVFPKLEDGADQVVTACHSKGQRERA